MTFEKSQMRTWVNDFGFSISGLDCYNVVSRYGSRTALSANLSIGSTVQMATKPGPRTSNTASDRVTSTLSLWGRVMGSTTEITASPRLRSMFAVAAFIMLALWGWSLVPPIENWSNPYEDGFSYVPVFYTTIICLPVGIYLLVGAIAGHGRYVRHARIAFLSLPV